MLGTTLTTLEFVTISFLKATGETFTGSAGDEDYEIYRNLGNFYIYEWADEPDTTWESLYDPEYSIGTVSNTDTYDLDDEIRQLSREPGDVVRIDHTDGVGYTNYIIVKAKQLKRYYEGNKSVSHGNYCAQVGRTIVFNHTFVSTDPQYGGSIVAPIYNYPDLLVNSGDTVPVDIPNWLVLIVAAEIVRNDITKQNQYKNLLGEANQKMLTMKGNNDASQEESFESVPVGGGADW